MSLDPTGASKTARGSHGPTKCCVSGYTSTRLDHDSANKRRWMYRLQSRFHEHLVWELTCFGADLHLPQSDRIQVLSGAFYCGVHGVPHTSESGQVPQLERVLTKKLSRAKLK